MNLELPLKVPEEQEETPMLCKYFKVKHDATRNPRHVNWRSVLMLWRAETKLTVRAAWYYLYGKQILNEHSGAFDEIGGLTDNLPLFDWLRHCYLAIMSCMIMVILKSVLSDVQPFRIRMENWNLRKSLSAWRLCGRTVCMGKLCHMWFFGMMLSRILPAERCSDRSLICQGKDTWGGSPQLKSDAKVFQITRRVGVVNSGFASLWWHLEKAQLAATESLKLINWRRITPFVDAIIPE